MHKNIKKNKVFNWFMNEINRFIEKKKYMF